VRRTEHRRFRYRSHTHVGIVGSPFARQSVQNEKHTLCGDRRDLRSDVNVKRRRVRQRTHGKHFGFSFETYETRHDQARGDTYNPNDDNYYRDECCSPPDRWGGGPSQSPSVLPRCRVPISVTIVVRRFRKQKRRARGRRRRKVSRRETVFNDRTSGEKTATNEYAARLKPRGKVFFFLHPNLIRVTTRIIVLNTH